MKFFNHTTISGLSFVFLTFLVSTATAPLQAGQAVSLAGVEPYTAEFDFFVDGEGGERVEAGSWTDAVTVADGQLSRTVKRYTPAGEMDLLRTVVVEQGSAFVACSSS